jgi:hypothetical protein
MEDNRETKTQNHPISSARRVEQVCDRFEAAWRRGEQPLMASFLEELDASMRPDLLHELISLEVELRREFGETPLLDVRVPPLRTDANAARFELFKEEGKQENPGESEREIPQHRLARESASQGVRPQTVKASALAEVASPVSVVELLKAAGQLGPSELREFVSGTLEMRARREAPVASARESELLLHVNQSLPEDLSRRLKTLTEKRRAEDLTSEEHAELLFLGDEAERMEASRLNSLSELATVRRIAVPDLMSALGLVPPTHG